MAAEEEFPVDKNPRVSTFLGGDLGKAVGTGLAAVSAINMATSAIKESGGVGNAIKDFAKGFVSSDVMRDWRHASKLYIDDNLKLVPKFSSLFHVSFELGTIASGKINRNANLEQGMLVKSFSLPRFTVDTKVLNQYNKPDIVQTKIKYETVDITFHDDSAQTIMSLWKNYNLYYFRDTAGQKNTNAQYTNASKYSTAVPQADWGYTPESAAETNQDRLVAFFQSIKLYSLSQKKFTEYTLVRPVIKSFTFGSHNASSNTELLEIKMTLEYEVALYNSGSIGKKATVPGFTEIHYDKGPSPLSALGGGVASLLGAGGLLDTGGSILDDLSGKEPNFASALFKGAKAVGTFSGQNLGKMALGEIQSMGMAALQGKPVMIAGQSMFPTVNVGKSIVDATNSVFKGGPAAKAEPEVRQPPAPTDLGDTSYI